MRVALTVVDIFPKRSFFIGKVVVAMIKGDVGKCSKSQFLWFEATQWRDRRS